MKGALYEIIVRISILFPQNVSLKAGRAFRLRCSLFPREPQPAVSAPAGMRWQSRGLGLHPAEAGLGAAVGGLDGKAKSSACAEDALLPLFYVNSLGNWQDNHLIFFQTQLFIGLEIILVSL